MRVDPLEVVPQPFRMLLALRSATLRGWAEGGWSLQWSGRVATPASFAAVA